MTLTTISVVFLFLVGVNAKETLHLGVLISQEGDFADNRGFIPTMNLALETINNDTTLPFSFNIVLNDSMVRRKPRISYVTWLASRLLGLYTGRQ